MLNIKAVVFDCDGVLVDSQAANLAYYNAILEHFGAPAVTDKQPDQVVLCHTASSPQVFKQLLGEALAPHAIAYARQIDYAQFIPQLNLEAGICDVLPCLNSTFPLAIATNRGSSMRQILEYFHFESYFAQVVTYLDVKAAKPAPDMLLEVAARLGLETTEILFIGDSELDQQAANMAGCHFVAYKWDGVAGGLRIDHHRQLLELLQ
jgi:HAD superfamily hydrolase (TIGR01509 family)